MYTKEEETIHFIIKAFNNKKRRKENINSSFHSISVGYMLKDINCSETIVISGFLHDIIEDTKYGYEDIKNKFGSIISDNVLKVTEDKKIKDWKLRKIEFIERLKEYDKDIILIELTDKLQNLLSDYQLFLKKGKNALYTSNATYELNKWYYLEMKKLFNDRLEKNNLLDRYNEITDIYFNK